MPKVSLIAAISENRALGKGNQLLFKIPEDQQYFKKVTLGHPVIMGRKTHESIGRPLSNRLNIVISREGGYQAPGCSVVGSVDEALKLAGERDPQEVFVIGGGQIYAATIDQADKLYLTIVHNDFEGDTFFPDYSQFTKVISRRDGEHDGLTYTILELER